MKALLCLLAVGVHAQMIALRAFHLGDERDEASFFETKWERAGGGSVKMAGISRERGEIWFAATTGKGLTLTALNGHGEPLRSWPVETPLTYSEAEARSIDILDLGKKGSWVIIDGGFSRPVTAYDLDGKKAWDFSLPAQAAESVAVVPKDLGGPLVVLGYQYGDAMRALDAKGAQAWVSADIPRADDVRAVRLGKKTFVSSTDGVGNITLIDLKGKVQERIRLGGNLDRVQFDERDGQRWLFGFDSRAGSWKETFYVYRSTAQGSWTKDVEQDLGRITITSHSLGDFDGLGVPQPVIGTENGWVLVLDRAGRVVSENRYRGPIRYLSALDLNGDKKDELIVAVGGASGKIVALKRK